MYVQCSGPQSVLSLQASDPWAFRLQVPGGVSPILREVIISDEERNKLVLNLNTLLILFIQRRQSITAKVRDRRRP